ncbi:NAD-dependent epimerase/dehydratase family protein [Nakamurella endophytica]|uniref:NAD-dependent epimerase/dehydratase domain-containing protein n=1 Tax=Nakamurella endophytica TaxID=1748367 RepID=A0A917SZP2_9ACTN|nr:NAD-dependent epimerase/dehydratase family protein [Nakamurella endophytica]GGM04091.1 hypothetical protein GCM10011594_25400 [Nakamurella endophytica]
MTGRTILVTGVTRYLGSALAGQLAAHPDVDRVIGVDAALPEPAARARMGAAEFARADIRNPLIARVLDAAGVDTVVHASASATPASAAARTMAKEMNVLGTLQLLAACQRTPSVAHVVVRSTSAVYGGSPRDPAVATEDTQPRSVPGTGPGRDAIDIEGYVRSFGRRRPDVRVAVPRLAEVVGPTVRTPLTRLFSLYPAVPVLAGRDARLQVLHEADAVAVLQRLALGPFAGVVNVAGEGALTVVQAVHRAGRIPLPVPSSGLGLWARGLQAVRIGGFQPEVVRSLAAGRVMDLGRLQRDVGYRPAMTTVQAFDDFARTLTPALDRRLVRDVEVRLAGALGARPEDPWSAAATRPGGSGRVPAPDARSGASSPGRRHLVSIDGQAGGTPRRPGRWR